MKKIFSILSCFVLFLMLNASCSKEALYCGNGIVDEGETCDAGENFKPCDYGDVTCQYCASDCKSIIVADYCGDGEVNNEEICDNGTEIRVCAYGDTDCQACQQDCQGFIRTPSCGDGFIDNTYAELCDDGNTVDEQCSYADTTCLACNADCSAVIIANSCGDNIVTDDEFCDDGNNVTENTCAYGDRNCDGGCNFDCSAQILPNYCGDGITDFLYNEVCDDGNNLYEDIDYADTTAQGCSPDCDYLIYPRICGDGTLDSDDGEICDDNNNITETCEYGDENCAGGCGNDCTFFNVAHYCGDGIVDYNNAEECELIEGSSPQIGDCQANCTYDYCGNGILSLTEECDNGLDNSNILSDSCRTNCYNSFCGDGVVDTGEECEPESFPNGCDLECQVALNFTQITSGYNHTCALDTDNKIFCWGSNLTGQFAKEDISYSKTPIQVGTLSNWSYIDAQDCRTCAIGDIGIQCWGNDCNSSYKEPTLISALNTWSSLAIGTEGYFCSIDADNSLWCWGENSNYQLGLSDKSSRSDPEKVGIATDWDSISAGSSFTCGIRSESLWCWGTLNQQLYAKEPVELDDSNTWVSVSVGSSHVCALDSEFKAWCFGKNNKGQLGTGVKSSGSSFTPTQVDDATLTFSKISVAKTHSCAIDSNNAIWCWGRNIKAQLGNGTYEDSLVPVNVSTSGNWSSYLTDDTISWSNISAGEYHTCATREDTTTWCWGMDSTGQIGNGVDLNIRNYPIEASRRAYWNTVAVGHDFVCLLDDNNELWCTHQDRSYTIFSRFTNISNSIKFNSIYAQVDSTELCALDESNQLYCLENVKEGSDLVLIDEVNDWILYASGNKHTCAINASSQLYCWGDNTYGQLGNNSNISESDPILISFASSWISVGVGEKHTCAIDSQNYLYCWGRIGQGLSNSPDADKLLPTLVGDESNIWLDVQVTNNRTCALQSHVPSSGTDESITLWCWGEDVLLPHLVGNYNDNWASFSVGESHTCGIRQDDTLWCFGDNSKGQLGISSLEDYHYQPVQVKGSFVDVSVHKSSTCAISTDSVLFCWGDNSQIKDFVDIDNTLFIASNCIERLDESQVCYPYPFDDVYILYNTPQWVVK